MIYRFNLQQRGDMDLSCDIHAIYCGTRRHVSPLPIALD